MTNKRAEPISYRPFAAKGAAAEGLLPVARELLGGDVEARLAQGWFRLAGLAGQYADKETAAWGAKRGRAAALNARLEPVQVEGGSDGKLPLPAGTRRPFKTSDPVAGGLEPHQVALLNAIAGGESGGHYNIRYTPQGGVLFDDMSQHPRVMEPTKTGQMSSAAGRYQFTATTWDRMGGGDFSPSNQDRKALQLAGEVYSQKTGRNLDEDLKAGGLTPQIVAVLGGTWEALNQGADRHIATYQDSLNRHAGGGGEKMAVAAPAIEPVVMKSGGGGGFKPYKGNSVFERAYNAVGTRTYLQQLDVAIQADVLSVYDKLGSDPAEFDKGLAALKKLHIEEHGVPDEIRGDYEAAFARAALPFQRQARLEQKKRIESQNKADFHERVNVLETERGRRLELLSMDNEAAIDGIGQVQGAIDDHYDAAVLHGLMSAEQAGNAKILSRRAGAVAFYQKQAAGKTPAEINAMIEEMRADFSQGKLDGLDAAGWSQLEASLKALERGGVAESKRAAGDYAKRGQSLVQRIELGYEIEADAMAQFGLDQNGVEDGDKIYREVMAQLEIARAVRDKTVGEAVDYVRQMQAEMGNTPTDEEIGLLDYAQKAVKNKGEMLDKDPLGYGEALRLIAPLDSVLKDMTPEGISAAIEERLAAGKQIGEHFGIAPRFFKTGEVEKLSKYVSENPESGVMIAASIVQAGGDDVGQLLAEFGDKGAAVLQAGAILAMDGQPQAAVDVIYGSAAKDEDGKSYQTIGPQLRQEWEAAILGSATDWLPDDMERIKGAAYAITKRRMYLQGIDEKDEQAVEEVYIQALQEAAGQVREGGEIYGGVVAFKPDVGWLGSKNHVLVLPEIRANRFEDVMAAIKMSDFDDADIKPVRADGKTPLPDGYFGRFYPVRWEGGYRLSYSNPARQVPQWIRGSDGNPFVYDPLAYKDRLAVRVPGAFRQ